jgi:hypothetical protein
VLRTKGGTELSLSARATQKENQIFCNFQRNAISQVFADESKS